MGLDGDRCAEPFCAEGHRAAGGLGPRMTCNHPLGTSTVLHPLRTMSNDRLGRVCVKVLGAVTQAKSYFSDNALKFDKSCEDLSRNHRTSTSHRSEANVIAERAVRRVKEGTSAAWDEMNT